MSSSLKRMSDMGAKNGEDMFDVIEDDFCVRKCNFDLLVVNNIANQLVIKNLNLNFGPIWTFDS